MAQMNARAGAGEHAEPRPRIDRRIGAKTIGGQWLDVEIANGTAEDFPPRRQPFPLRIVVGGEPKRRHVARGRCCRGHAQSPLALIPFPGAAGQYSSRCRACRLGRRLRSARKTCRLYILSYRLSTRGTVAWQALSPRGRPNGSSNIAPARFEASQWLILTNRIHDARRSSGTGCVARLAKDVGATARSAIGARRLDQPRTRTLRATIVCAKR